MESRRWWSNLKILLPWAPYWSRSWKHRLGRQIYLIMILYVGVLLLLLALENYFLFPRTTASQGWEDPPEGLALEDETLLSSDGTPIHIWFSAPPGWTPEAGALLLSHGNAGNLSIRGQVMPFIQARLHVAVLLYDYPGYGKSGGKPSEAGCYAAGDSAYAFLTDKKKVAGDRIILYGGSLGGAVAIDMATRHPHRAVVVVSTFTSFPDMAQVKFPWLPARWLVRNQFLSINKIATLHTPVFIAHDTDDDIVPYEQGKRLFTAANEPKRFLTMHGVGHTDVPAEALYGPLKAFLDEKAPLEKE